MAVKIQGGLVIDGTGKPAQKMDVVIDGDQISYVGNEYSGSLDDIMDAQHLIVAPGFIDVHSHADFGILSWPQMSAKLLQGVTTDVVGNCGLGFFPVNEFVAGYYDSIVKNLLGMEVSRFERLRDFMGAIEQQGTGPNLAFLVPQGNVRAFVMGLEEGNPTADQLAEMQNIVSEGMQDGAYGLSTGLVYPPGSNSTTAELVELCKVVAQFGGIYTSHVRDEGAGYLTALQEAVDIGRQSGCRVEISHVKIAIPFVQMKRLRSVVELLNRARNEGVALTADLYPYTSSDTELSIMVLRPWVFEGGIEQLQGRLRDPVNRSRIINDFLDTVFTQFKMPAILNIFPRKTLAKLILSVVKNRTRVVAVKYHHELEGLTLGEIIRKKYPKRDVFNAAMDFLADEDASITISPELMKQKTIDQLIKLPYMMVGSDSIVPVEGNAHPRSFGTFPRVLHDIVGRGVLPLETAIYKMTGLPAQTFQIQNRGLIQKGYYADLVIFDPKTIRDTAVIGNARQYPEGIKFIIVNGEIAAQNSQPTTNLFGKVLKHESIS